MDQQHQRKKKSDKAKEKFERNGGFSKKHVRLAEALAEKRKARPAPFFIWKKIGSISPHSTSSPKMSTIIKYFRKITVEINEAMFEATADTLPLTTPTSPSPLNEIVVHGFKPERPCFHSNHGAKAPYLYHR